MRSITPWGSSAGRNAIDGIGGPWTPARLFGLQLFLWEAPGKVSPSTIGSGFGTVAPQFGTSIAGTASGVQPILRVDGAQFDGAGDDTITLSETISLPGDFTFYAVGITTAAPWIPLASTTTSSGIYVIYDGLTVQDDNAVQQYILSPDLSIGDLNLVRVGSSGGTVSLLTTGNISTASAAQGPFTFDSIGNWANGGMNDGGGAARHVAQILITGRDISGTDDETHLLAWISTQLGAVFTEPDAVKIINAISATGVTLTTAQVSAINQFVISMKTNALWSTMTAIFGYVGGTAAAHAVDWKNPGTNSMIWHGGVTYSANGVQGDGSTGWGDTGIAGSALTSTNFGASIFLQTSSSLSGTTYDFGSYGSSSSQFFFGQSPTAAVAQSVTAASELSVNGASIPAGMWTITRVSATDFKWYNGITFLRTSSASDGGNLPTSNIAVLAQNNNGLGQNFSGRQQSFLAVHRGFTNLQSSALYNIVHALQTALSRTVH